MDYKKELEVLRAKMVYEITELMKACKVDRIPLYGANNVGISIPHFNTTGTTIMEYDARELELKDGVVYVILDRRPKRVLLSDLHCKMLDFYAIGRIYDFVTKKYHKTK